MAEVLHLITKEVTLHRFECYACFTQPGKHSVQVGQVFFGSPGEHNDIVQIHQGDLPLDSGKYQVNSTLV